MANHMTAIGFPVASDGDFEHYAAITQFNGQLIETAAVNYRRLIVGDGVELWLEEDSEGNPRQMNPHFFGAARMKLRIVGRSLTPRGDTSNKAFEAWADPEGDHGTEPGAFPLVFDSPDFHLYDSLELPAIEEVQLAAFAETINVYASETEMRADEAESVPSAVKSFVPLHHFTSPEIQSIAYAQISGVVTDSKIIENQKTPESFCWARLQTYCGEVDVVADPTLLERVPVAGEIIRGYFWLSGRIPERCPDAAAQHTQEEEPILETPQDYLSRAQHFAWGRHQYAKAIELLREATRIDPDFVFGYFLLGNVLQETGAYEESIEAFENVLRINPNDSGAFNNIANAYRQLGRLAESAAVIERWLAAEPDSDPPNFDGAYYNLALTRAAEGLFAEAERICREDISASNRKRELGSMGLYFSSMGRHADAIRLLEEVVENDPDDMHKNFDLGRAYANAGDREGALRQYQVLLGMDEEWAQSLLNSLEPIH